MTTLIYNFFTEAPFRLPGSEMAAAFPALLVPAVRRPTALPMRGVLAYGAAVPAAEIAAPADVEDHCAHAASPFA